MQKIMSLLALYLLKSCTEAITRELKSSPTQQWKNEWSTKRIEVSFGKTMMRALEPMRLAKRHILGQSDVQQCKNRTHSLGGYQVVLNQ